MKRINTTIPTAGFVRNHGAAAALAAALVLALGLGLAAPRAARAAEPAASYAKVLVDTRTGVRGADETERLTLPSRLPGAEGAELWIDGQPVDGATVGFTTWDGVPNDGWYFWDYPAGGAESDIHTVALVSGGTEVWTAKFGNGDFVDKHSLSGVPYVWLSKWDKYNKYITEHWNGDWEAAGNGTAANGMRMYDVYVAALSPADPDARFTFRLERLLAATESHARDARDAGEQQILLYCPSSVVDDYTGPRRYVLEAADTLVPPEGSTEDDLWREVRDLPEGTLLIGLDELRSLGHFLRVRVMLP